MSNKTPRKRRNKNVVEVVNITTALVPIEQAAPVAAEPEIMTAEQVEAMLLDTAKSVGSTALVVIENDDDDVEEAAAGPNVARDEFLFAIGTRAARINAVLRAAEKPLTKAEIVKRAGCTKLPRVWRHKMLNTHVRLFRNEYSQYVYAFKS